MKTHAISVIFATLFAAQAAYADTVTQSLQPGYYSNYDITGPYTGLLREDGTTIGSWDDPTAFALPDHIQANQLWFTSGWMTWGFLVNIPNHSKIESVSYTAEISSECPGACPIWPSDLTISFNGVEVNTWTIPGDPDTGWLVTWTINKEGAYFQYKFKDGDLPIEKVSDVNIDSLAITPGGYINVKLSVIYIPMVVV